MSHDKSPPLAGQPVPFDLMADNQRVVCTVRIEKDVWEALEQAARNIGMDRSALLRQIARWCVGVPDAQLPPRSVEHD